MQSDSLLNKTASIKILHKLNQDGSLNDNAFISAKKVLRPFSAWLFWSNRLLLFFGTVLILAGVVFFFAYNWAEFGKFLKFGFIELSIIGCILAVYIRGLNHISSKVLILSSSVLTGVLLAVYGQTYQTGADAYELFQTWAFLVFGWVVISEFAALWFAWLVIVNTAVILFWFQVGRFGYAMPYEKLCIAVAVINGFALLLREIGLINGIKWLTGKWLRVVLLVVLLVVLSIPSIHLIIASRKIYGSPNNITSLVLGIWVLVSFVGYLFYRYKLREMFPLAIIVLNACVILMTFIGKKMFHNHSRDEVTILLFAFIILIVFSSAAFWLKKVNTAILTNERRKTNDL